MNERTKKLHEDLADRFSGLLEEIIEEAEQAAVDAMQDQHPRNPIKAKVAAAVEWDAGSMRPAVRVKLSYSTKHLAESEARLDFDQEQFDWGDDAGIDKVSMKVGDGPETTIYEKEASK